MGLYLEPPGGAVVLSIDEKNSDLATPAENGLHPVLGETGDPAVGYSRVHAEISSVSGPELPMQVVHP